MIADPSTPLRTSLKPYPAMKDSGVPWLGEVPEHWEIVALRRKLKPYDGIKIGPFGSQVKLEQMSESGFKVYGQANVIARDFTRGGKFVDQVKFDELSACEIRPGDLVITMMGTSGRCALVPDDAVPGIMDSHLIRLRTTAEIDVSFAARMIDEAPYVKEQIAVAGKGSIMHGLNSNMIKDLAIALPPLSEQAAIVRFLDHYDRKIRRYIRAKQKLIKLLEEQKQTIIHHTVTRGLDPNVRLKPSGVDWLGDIPAHWEVRKLHQCVSILGGMTPSMEVPRFWGGEIPWVTPKDMKRMAVGDSILRVTDVAVQETSLRLIDPPAILMVVRGMILARRVPIAWATVPLTVNQDMKALKPVQGINAEFFARVLDSAQEAFIPLIDEAGHGTRRLPTERWRNLAVAIPPEDEQEKILRYLTETTQSIVTAIEYAGREITLLREYRIRLIADLVTGKLDVREVAAQLPEEVEESELPEEIEGQVEGEEETEGTDLDMAPEEASIAD